MDLAHAECCPAISLDTKNKYILLVLSSIYQKSIDLVIESRDLKNHRIVIDYENRAFSKTILLKPQLHHIFISLKTV